ncbi:MAG TPA: DUF167 domain-containing protein [bacterium]|nr:DUF167 domain-containing protein [bacterium]
MIKETQPAIIIEVKVQPNANKSEICGKMADGSLKIKVKAPASENKANAELINILSEAFDTKKSNIEIISGKTNTRKKIKIKTH